MIHEPYIDDFKGITCECGEMRAGETWVEHWVRATGLTALLAEYDEYDSGSVQQLGRAVYQLLRATPPSKEVTA